MKETEERKNEQKKEEERKPLTQDEMIDDMLRVITVEAFVDWLIKYKGMHSDQSIRENVISNLRNLVAKEVCKDRMNRPTTFVTVNNVYSLFGRRSKEEKIREQISESTNETSPV